MGLHHLGSLRSLWIGAHNAAAGSCPIFLQLCPNPEAGSAAGVDSAHSSCVRWTLNCLACEGLRGSHRSASEICPAL